LTPGNFIDSGGFRRVAGKGKYYLGEFPKEYICKKDDLIIAMTQQAAGLLGSTAFVPEDGIYLHNQRIGLITTNSLTDSNYIYYLFMTSWIRKRLEKTATGSKVKHTSPESIYEIPVLVPKDVKEQAHIAAVLSVIDEKIALNHRINTELEKVAQLLYNYWFVQYDFPNVEGKPYRQSGGEMMFSDVLKREIPKGWQIKQLHNVLDNITASAWPGEHLKGLFYTPLDDIPIRKMSFYGGQTYRNANSSLMIYKENDILMGAMRVHFHRVCLTAQDGITRSTTLVLRPRNPEHLSLLFQVVNGEDTIAYATKLSGKSQQPYVNWDNELGNFRFPLPSDDELILKYANIIKPYITQIKINERENFELSHLRDFLIPLLINGQVTMAAKAEVNTQELIATVDEHEEKRKTVFKRLVLSAYILDNICDEPTAGRVKFEKLLFLSEHCAKIPLHSEFKRAAAGPYDSKALYSIDGQLAKNKWFKRQHSKADSRAYVRMEKSTGYSAYLGTCFNKEQKDVIDKLLSLLKSQRTIKCEIVATLYGAWNDFLLEGKEPTNDQIVEEVLTHWHESKERIERDRWHKALDWMRQHKIVPTGFGVSTKIV
jgi:type I restriction enzyme S subunit